MPGAKRYSKKENARDQSERICSINNAKRGKIPRSNSYQHRRTLTQDSGRQRPLGPSPFTTSRTAFAPSQPIGRHSPPYSPLDSTHPSQPIGRHSPPYSPLDSTYPSQLIGRHSRPYSPLDSTHPSQPIGRHSPPYSPLDSTHPSQPIGRHSPPYSPLDSTHPSQPLGRHSSPHNPLDGTHPLTTPLDRTHPFTTPWTALTPLQPLSRHSPPSQPLEQPTTREGQVMTADNSSGRPIGSPKPPPPSLAHKDGAAADTNVTNKFERESNSRLAITSQRRYR
ncbi:uncharacterized protein [Palaemon carinicauda]|uniref:uncharacterized protein n=1 Tax=Palaemon carinicauda TaxID=392227 RepID=UPI0035B61225